jgi:hypothetical protein
MNVDACACLPSRQWACAPSPLPAGTGTAIEVERTELAGQRVTLRMDGTQMTFIGHDGTLLRTVPRPVPARDRARLRGARRSRISSPPAAGPVGVVARTTTSEVHRYKAYATRADTTRKET